MNRAVARPPTALFRQGKRDLPCGHSASLRPRAACLLVNGVYDVVPADCASRPPSRPGGPGMSRTPGWWPLAATLGLGPT